VPRFPGAILWFASFALLGIAASDAAPPENADPALHGWFESLKQPGSGVSCCSIADCRPVEYRLVAEGYEAYQRHDPVFCAGERDVITQS